MPGRPTDHLGRGGSGLRLKIAATATAVLAAVVAIQFRTDAGSHPALLAWTEMLLAALVCFGSAWPLHRRVLSGATRWVFDMSTLASLGMIAPFAAGASAVLAPGILPSTFRHDPAGIAFCFATASTAATFVLLGLVLEGRVRGESAMARHGYLGNPLLVGESARGGSGRLGRLLVDGFAPAVLIATLGTVVYWGFAEPSPRSSQALMSGLALLLVACPCAFGLAAPLSLIFAIRRSAASGILFKDAEAIEMTSRIDTVAMGKTDTLAMGRPDLASVVAVPSFDEEAVLYYAASLETGIRHPLALAVAQVARDRGIATTPATDVEVAPGRGVRGRIAGREVAVGNLSLMVHHDPDSGALGQQAETLRAAGETAVYVSLDGHPIGVLAFRDRIRESALAEIRALHEDGLRIVLLSGDGRTTALALAKRFELDDVLAEIPAGGKAAALAAIQEQGHRVAMVGDGDDAALGQADLGIEIGGIFDARRRGVRISLLDGDFGGIAKARGIARAARRNIRQNLFMAFGGSALGVVAASGIPRPFLGFSLSPEGAAVVLFSLTALVAANALRSPR